MALSEGAGPTEPTRTSARTRAGWRRARARAAAPPQLCPTTTTSSTSKRPSKWSAQSAFAASPRARTRVAPHPGRSGTTTRRVRLSRCATSPHTALLPGWPCRIKTVAPEPPPRRPSSIMAGHAGVGAPVGRSPRRSGFPSLGSAWVGRAAACFMTSGKRRPPARRRTCSCLSPLQGSHVGAVGIEAHEECARDVL